MLVLLSILFEWRAVELRFCFKACYGNSRGKNGGVSSVACYDYFKRNCRKIQIWKQGVSRVASRAGYSKMMLIIHV